VEGPSLNEWLQIVERRSLHFAPSALRSGRRIHKRKRRDQFPSLAASHAPSSSVRRTRRGARLATTPLRSREWPVNCGIPARHHHPRGTSSPCAWTVRIGPRHRFPVAHSPREEVRCPVEDDFGAALQSPSAAFATARNLTVPLSIRSPPGRSPNFVRRTFCLHTRSDKREIPQVSVSQWDNGDGFPGNTIEGGAPGPNALNPAPR